VYRWLSSPWVRVCQVANVFIAIYRAGGRQPKQFVMVHLAKFIIVHYSNPIIIWVRVATISLKIVHLSCTTLPFVCSCHCQISFVCTWLAALCSFSFSWFCLILLLTLLTVFSLFKCCNQEVLVRLYICTQICFRLTSISISTLGQ
jgi:hypothetical protein